MVHIYHLRQINKLKLSLGKSFLTGIITKSDAKYKAIFNDTFDNYLIFCAKQVFYSFNPYFLYNICHCGIIMAIANENLYQTDLRVA